ncbi:MAG: glycoside hydrolase family 2, partial [Bacteroidales bacterium]|nr:glycoside hydrolase family 2 [Bacteroidales bacterium]
MNRRRFVSKSALVTSGLLAAGRGYGFPGSSLYKREIIKERGLYDLFRNPGIHYRPFVRWWWNGNKVEADELVRELHIMKEAGIGGVEINPVQFPTRFDGDDLGKPSLKWLSPEWIRMLQVVFDETRSSGMTCDLIVGSGWPFGAEYLEGDELSQVVVIAVRKIKGPLTYETSRGEIFSEADPAVSSPYSGRTMELFSLILVPDPVSDMSEVTDFQDQTEEEYITVTVP